MMPDLAAGMAAVTPEVNEHLKSCADCAGKLEAFRQTMALLDEWKAPEPSPYFDVRLKARVREEIAQQPAGWLRWLRQACAGDVPRPDDGGERDAVPHESRPCRKHDDASVRCGSTNGGGTGHGGGRFAGAGEESESVLRL